MFIFISLLSLAACNFGEKPSAQQKGLSSHHRDNDHHQDPPSDSLEHIDCSPLLKHDDSDINKAYQESFKHLGAFLLYYQKKITELGETKAGVHMTELKSLGVTPPNYLGYKIDELSIKTIDTDLKQPRARATWQAWCQHPGNFVCHFFKFISHGALKNSKNIEDIFFKSNPYHNRPELFAWFDDGIWTMQTLIFGKSTGPENKAQAHADPSMWCE